MPLLQFFIYVSSGILVCILYYVLANQLHDYFYKKFYKSNLQDSKLRAWIFLAPALIILFIFLIYPVAETTRLSFLDNHGREFKGINNYIWAINDSDFRQSILNNTLKFSSMII